MDYVITMTIYRSGDEVNVVDNFVTWFDAQNDDIVKTGSNTWRISADMGFRRETDDDGPVLFSEGLTPDGLHRILSAFFRYAGTEKSYAAIMPHGPDAPNTLVLITNDPEVETNPPGGPNCMVRSYQASAVLGSAALFSRLGGQMFGDDNAAHADDGADDDDAEIISTGRGPWIFAALGGEIDDASETIALLGGEQVMPELVLVEVLNVPHYKVSAEDYYTFEDDANGATVVVQTFPTEAGPFVELRLTLPSALREDAILDRLTQRSLEAGVTEVLRVIEYDDIEATAQAVPLRADGTTGVMRILQLQF